MSQATPTTLQVLGLLQAHRRLTVADMGARLGISADTVRERIATLQEFGLPIKSGRDAGSAYLLHPGVELPPIMFSEGEAVALTVALIAAAELELGDLQTAAATALAKVERLLPLAVRSRVEDASERLHLSVADIAAAHEHVAIFSIATQSHRRLAISYRALNKELTEREVDSYGLVHHQGQWYSVGYCHLRKDLRVFRLDRVHSVLLLPTEFTSAPPDFNALDYVIASLASAPRS